jgi:AP-2 complex subunit sigma-1
VQLVYRRYAGLYFCLCVDVSDNELVALELIHLFVEALDAYFGNVCELDLVFNFAKVYQMLDEIVVGGELIETSKARILQRVDELDQLP